MDFSSLVLVERDKETNNIIRELGSYEVPDGAQHITRLYYDGECINLFFDTGRDVEEWEFTAIFDLFEIDPFREMGFDIQDVDDEYNPTWQLKFEYNDDHELVKGKIAEACQLIVRGMDKVFEDIKGKKEEYV